MRAANDNRRRKRRTITIDEWDEGGDLYGALLVSIYKGVPTGEPEYCEMIEGPETAFAYAQSMARHLRCPIHDKTRKAS